MGKTVFKKTTASVLAALLILALLPAAKASASAAQDEYYYLQWALNNNGSFSQNAYGVTEPASVSGVDISMEQAWDEYTSGRKVTVAIIDTGVDVTNSDLTGHLWTNPGEIAGNGIDDDGNGYVDDVHGWNFRDGSNVLYTAGQDAHGTHCCGTIAADCNSSGIAGICGASGSIKVMVLKAFDGVTNLGKTQDIISAIKYAKANGASIVNLSLGLDAYKSELYQVMRDSGLLFVCAAGNNGCDADTTPTYPAAFDLDNVISVASVDSSGTLESESNYGRKTVDLGAPGTNILSYGSDGKLYYMTGTSMAAPMVTAVAALVYSKYSSASISRVKGIILGTVSPLSSLYGKTVTGGMLNAAAALSVTVDETPVFSDIKTTDWFYNYVSSLAARGVISGYTDGTFRPYSNVSVGEALKLILLAAGFDAQSPTDSSWASGYRDLALKNGIVKSADVKNLNAAASRGFIAVTAAKALKLAPSASATPFADVNDPYITALYEAGVIEGSFTASGQRVFRPSAGITRAEVSAIIWRM
jgi:subtilisin family serine protease